MSEEKVCLWLQEDILNRQAPTPKRRQPRQRQQQQPKGALGKRKRGPNAAIDIALEPVPFESTEEDDLAAIAAQLQVPLEAVPDMLADDRLYADDLVEIDDDGDVVVLGALLKSGTIDTYVAAVAELYKIQYSTGLPVQPVLRGPALRGLLESRKKAQDANNRAAFVDRGASGITAGYTNAEFLQLQEMLLQSSEQNPIVSLVLLY